MTHRGARLFRFRHQHRQLRGARSVIGALCGDRFRSGYRLCGGTAVLRPADQIIAFVKARGWVVDWLIETHVHADHLSAAPLSSGGLGGKIGIGERIRQVQESVRQGVQRRHRVSARRFAVRCVVR